MRLSKAYATVNDWTVGYATSTFSDGMALAPTVDANGSTMSMDFTALLVRWMHTFRKSGITLGLSVETPDMNLDTDNGNTAPRSCSLPNLAAMVQYEWAPDQHVRLSGITRFLPYRDLVNGSNHTPVGYGLQLSTVFNPTPSLTVYGIGNVGRSYSNVGGDFELELLPRTQLPLLSQVHDVVHVWRSPQQYLGTPFGRRLQIWTLRMCQHLLQRYTPHPDRS